MKKKIEKLDLGELDKQVSKERVTYSDKLTLMSCSWTVSKERANRQTDKQIYKESERQTDRQTFRLDEMREGSLRHEKGRVSVGCHHLPGSANKLNLRISF